MIPTMRLIVVVLKELTFEKGLSMSAGNTDYSIPTLPSRVGMKDCFLDTLFSPGEACEEQLRNVLVP